MENENSELRMLRSACAELGVPNLLEVLSSAPMRRLALIMVRAFKNRAGAKKPTDLLREYESKLEFFGPSGLSQKELFDFAKTCHSAIPDDFDIVQTSPIAPLGVNAVLSSVSQNNTLSSIRGSEVVSDITTQLALECARRRKAALSIGPSDKAATVNLCSSGRVLRLQPFDKTKGYMQHFNLFALCSGGRNSSSDGGFAVPTIGTHIAILLSVLDQLGQSGYQFHEVVVKLSDMRFLDQLIAALSLDRANILRNSLNDSFDLFEEYKVNFPREVDKASLLNSEIFTRLGLTDRTSYFSHLETKALELLRRKHPNTRFCFDFTRKSGLGYYPHLCFHIFAKTQTGDNVQLADGGAVDWSAKLLGNKREALVTSGIGSELMQKLFR